MNTFTARIYGKIPSINSQTLPNPFLWGGDNHSNESKMKILLSDWNKIILNMKDFFYVNLNWTA